MKITIQGCEPLVLDADVIAPESGKFDATTSYASKLVSRLGQKAYREGKLPLKLECLRQLSLKAASLSPYQSYYEPLAGVGLAVKLFAPKGKLWLNDMDPGCQAVLKANFPKATVWGGDIKGQMYPDADMIFLDFNDYTFKRYLTTDYSTLLARGFEHARKFVVLNDCSPFYFRYGESSFKAYSKLMGSPVTSIDDYLKVAARFYAHTYPEWRMVKATYFRESSFQLFYRGGTLLRQGDKVTTGLPVKVSQGLLS